jgi:type I restriction enzyme S subunit
VPAEVLLKRILAERRAKWEAEHPGKKYVEPAAPETEGLPELPEGWCYVQLDNIAEVRLGRQRSPSRATGPNMRSYLRAANVTWSGLDLSDVKQMDFSPEEQKIYRIKYGDVLLGEASGSISEVGKPAIWKDELEEVYFQNTLIRVRSDGPLPSYLYVQFLHDAVSERFRSIAKGVGIHHLGAGNVSGWIVTVPPLAEQERIVAEVERQLSVVAELEATVAANLARAGRLRQAILKRAFEGKLVAQDPNDEPASVLLERISLTGAQRRLL